MLCLSDEALTPTGETFLVIFGGGAFRIRIPWTYVPGNHDDDDAPWSRNDLLEIYELPGCVAKGARSFNHTLTVGSAQGGLWHWVMGLSPRVMAIQFFFVQKAWGVYGMTCIFKFSNSCKLQLTHWIIDCFCCCRQRSVCQYSIYH